MINQQSKNSDTTGDNIHLFHTTSSGSIWCIFRFDSLCHLGLDLKCKQFTLYYMNSFSEFCVNERLIKTGRPMQWVTWCHLVSLRWRFITLDYTKNGPNFLLCSCRCLPIFLLLRSFSPSFVHAKPVLMNWFIHPYSISALCRVQIIHFHSLCL